MLLLYRLYLPTFKVQTISCFFLEVVLTPQEIRYEIQTRHTPHLNLHNKVPLTSTTFSVLTCSSFRSKLIVVLPNICSLLCSITVYLVSVWDSRYRVLCETFVDMIVCKAVCIFCEMNCYRTVDPTQDMLRIIHCGVA